MQLDDILERLAGLPEKKQQEVIAEAYEATKHLPFIPSPGPQSDAYFSEADVLLYGGSPGGGKTALEVGLALNCHKRTLIVRRNFVDLAGVLHTLDNILGKENSAVGGMRPLYRKPEGGVIDFMGLGESIDGKQGNPHDLICVGRGTPVLMADGSYKPVEEVQVGDEVETLEGARKVLNAFPTPPKDAVRVTLPSGVSQVQSATHKLLTPSGWCAVAPRPYAPTLTLADNRNGLFTRKWWYAHPYTQAPRSSTAVHFESDFAVEPVGPLELFDLEIEEVNHFITVGGFINKNCVDEAAQIPESQVRMLIGWLRTEVAGQRCRVVLGSNPPLNSTGDWLIDYFAPWLNPQHPNPAQEGELRYFLPSHDGQGDRECGKDEFIELHGVKVAPQSRTFISSKFTDNPYYDAEQYAKSLAGLPDAAREVLISGNFLLTRSDDIWQAIPTPWIREAQARWSPTPPVGVPMCCIGVDIAQGGNDQTVLAIRHDGWYAPLVAVPGKETPDGKIAAGLVVAKRRNNAKVIVDVGGGWGADAYAHLKENGVDVKSYMGVKSSKHRTVDKQLKFFNVRAEAYWRFREALDPSQEGGSQIMLPPDAELVADLCAPTYEVGTNGIKIESKEKVCDRIGRSTDKGDAVVMAWWDGLKQMNVPGGWKARRAAPKVLMGRAPARR